MMSSTGSSRTGRLTWPKYAARCSNKGSATLATPDVSLPSISDVESREHSCSGRHLLGRADPLGVARRLIQRPPLYASTAFRNHPEFRGGDWRDSAPRLGDHEGGGSRLPDWQWNSSHPRGPDGGVSVRRERGVPLRHS